MDLSLALNAMVSIYKSIAHNTCSQVLFKDKRSLYDFALMDVAPSDYSEAEAEAYLNEISEKVAAYMRTDAVWSQDELKNSLSRIVDERSGKFCCILGGVNTGKSLVLSELMSRNNTQSVALVDMRDGNSVLEGLIWSLRRDYSEVFYAALLEVVKTLPSRFSVTDSIRLTYSSTQDDMLSYFLETDRISDVRKLGLLLSEVAKKSPKNAAGCGLTLIIDQANIAFTDRSDEDARRTLALFVALTKKRHEVSCFMYVLYVSCIPYIRRTVRALSD